MITQKKKNYPKLNKDAGLKSAKATVQKWIIHFIETDYPNRMITNQTVEIFTKAKYYDINFPESYNHLINDSILEAERIKKKRRKSSKAFQDATRYHLRKQICA